MCIYIHTYAKYFYIHSVHVHACALMYSRVITCACMTGNASTNKVMFGEIFVNLIVMHIVSKVQVYTQIRTFFCVSHTMVWCMVHCRVKYADSSAYLF
jgi:hypothetical protein